jgi:hypothetical protein
MLATMKLHGCEVSARLCRWHAWVDVLDAVQLILSLL